MRDEILKAGLSQGGFPPIVIACRYMDAHGDFEVAGELMASFIEGRELPPDWFPEWEMSVAVISHDSVGGFKKSSGAVAYIEPHLRYGLGKKHNFDKGSD